MITINPSLKYKMILPILSAVTATGSGEWFDLGELFKGFTMQIIWGGTTPTDTVVSLEGSLNGVNSAGPIKTLTTTAMDDGTQGWCISDSNFRYVRGNYISKTDGDTDTAVTLLLGVEGH